MGSDYKKTLNLPQTDFPMKAGLTTREPEQLAAWEKENIYARIQESRQDAPPSSSTTVRPSRTATSTWAPR